MPNKLAVAVAACGLLVVAITGFSYYGKYKSSRDAAAAQVAAIAKSRQQVVRSLKDPGSAQFRDEKWVDATNHLCGEVNAKNSLGGYVGFKRFIATPDDFLIQEAGFRTANTGRYKVIAELGSNAIEHAESDKFLAGEVFKLIWSEACSTAIELNTKS